MSLQRFLAGKSLAAHVTHMDLSMFLWWRWWRADGPMKERHHQTLGVASSPVILGFLFGKSVGGILGRKSQPIDDERSLGASLDFSE